MIELSSSTLMELSCELNELQLLNNENIMSRQKISYSEENIRWKFDFELVKMKEDCSD